MVQAPLGQFSQLEVAIEQGGKSYPIFSIEQPTEATTKQDAADRLYVMRPIGKSAIPALQQGPARIIVRTARPVLYGMRNASTEATRDVQVRLEPPQASHPVDVPLRQSRCAEFVVYRATPADSNQVFAWAIALIGFPATATACRTIRPARASSRCRTNRT